MTDQEPEATTPAPSAPAAPAGWYDDPATGTKRWWDGANWTEPAAAAPAVPKAPVQPLALFALIVGGVAFLFGLIPVLGLLLALGGLALAVIAIIKKQKPTWMPFVGGGLAAFAFITSLIVLVALISGGMKPPAIAGPTSDPKPTASAEKPEPDPDPVTVPDVVGKSVAAASSSLADVGLRLTGATDPDQIISEQSPAAGETADFGSRVTVTAVTDFSKYEKLSKRDYAQLAKNPDTFAGRQIIMYGNVFQFDSATGPCNALVNTAHKKQSYSFDYDVTTFIQGEPCSILDPIVEDDNVVLWVTVVGAYDYDTAMGGTNTAVSVIVEKVKTFAATAY